MENETVDTKRAEEWLDENDYYELADIERPELPQLLAIYAKSECKGLASRVEELEKVIAKHSGCLNSADSASGRESSSTAKEIR